MLVLGLTGGMASGKSTVAAMFAARGAAVIDADQVARRALRRDSTCFSGIVAAFGAGILTDGRIDRRKLARVAFSQRDSQQRLCAIVHPWTWRCIQRRIGVWRRAGHGIVVLEAALLLEAGWQRYVDYVVVIRCSRSEQVARAAAHRFLSAAEVRRRLAFQLPFCRQRKLSDWVIDNRFDLRRTARQVAEIWRHLPMPAGTAPPRNRRGVRECACEG